MSFVVTKLEKPLKIYIGKDFSKKFTFLDSDEVPIDLTGYSFKAQVRECKTNSNAIITFESPTSINITDATNGNIVLILSDAETVLLQEQNAVFDLQWTTTLNITNTLVEGTVQIIETITK